MLISLIALVPLLLSGGFRWLSAVTGDVPLRAGNKPISPEGPSTLALALIGIGTIAVYVGAKRVLGSVRQSAAETGRFSAAAPSGESVRNEPTMATGEVPAEAASRGAA